MTPQEAADLRLRYCPSAVPKWQRRYPAPVDEYFDMPMTLNGPQAIERWREMVRVLRALDPKKFNVKLFGNADGTVGDAAGWAARDPWFIEQGLTLERVPGTPEMTVRFKKHKGWIAVRDFFDLLDGDCAFLHWRTFHNDGHPPTPSTIIFHIGRMFEAHELSLGA